MGQTARGAWCGAITVAQGGALAVRLHGHASPYGDANGTLAETKRAFPTMLHASTAAYCPLLCFSYQDT